jgi:hypothetical protein
VDETEAEQAVRKLVDELHEARDAKDDAERRIAGLRKLIAGYIELFPLLESIPGEGDLDEPGEYGGDTRPRPRGMDAALRVLSDRAGNWYRVPVIVEMLDNAGWMPRSSNPRNAVRAALERLVENGAIERANAAADNAVIYSVPAPDDDEETDEWGEPPF